VPPGHRGPPWAWLRKNRGSFDREPRGPTADVQITATGRGDWIGWLELATQAINETRHPDDRPGHR
jgi:hypothetical protein